MDRGGAEMKRRFIIECECGCGEVRINRFDDNTVSMTYYVPAGYFDGTKMRGRLKMAWAILRGKDYCVYETLMTDDKFAEFQTFVVEDFNDTTP
jgi:hypothetical protein